MARRRFFDYKAPDATKLLNEEKRGILLAGVYFGFNCVPGSSGLQLSLTMDNDPDNTGSKLGAIITRDAVVIQEDADLINVATCGAAHASLPRIDSLVATYVYNAGLPNNDVTYQIVAGTASSNPVPPTLNDDQLLLANITIPALTTTLTTSMIADVNRRDIYGQQNLDLTNILRQGVYTGGVLSQGTAKNKVSLSGLTAITPQMKKVTVATVVDKFTLPDNANDNTARFDWVVMLHKFEDVENNPPDIIIVQGTGVNETFGQATIANDATILAAATAFNPKYNSSSHITKLGLLFVKGTIAGTMVVEYTHSPRLLQDLCFFVSAGKINSSGYLNTPNTQPWPFYGIAGIQSALTVLNQFVTDMYVGTDTPFISKSPIKLQVSGDFRFRPSEAVNVPSYVVIEGVGSTSFRFFAQANQQIAVLLGGIFNNGATSIRNASDGVSQTGVPGGFERIEIGWSSGNIPAPYNQIGITNNRHSGGLADGDEVVLSTANGSTVRRGWFESNVTTILADTAFTFTAIVASGYDKNNSVLGAIFKKRTGIRNVRIALEGTQTANTYLSLVAVCVDSCVIDQVEAPAVLWHCWNKNCFIGSLDIRGYHFRQNAPLPVADLIGYGNVYDKIDIITNWDTIDNSFGGSAVGALIQERDAVVGSITCAKTIVGGTSKFTLGFQNSSIGAVAVRDGYPGTAGVRINSYDCQIGSFRVNGPSTQVAAVAQVELTGERNTIGSLYAEGAVTLVYNNSLNSNGGRNSIGKITGYSISYTDSDDRKSYEIFQAIKNRDEDLNLKIFSTGTFNWISGTGTLTWSADIVIEHAYNAFNNRVLANNAVLADGDRLVATLQRDALSLTTISTSVVSKANAATTRNSETIVLATRVGTEVYLFDGTRVPSGQTLRLAQGTGDIPDGSITHPKLAANAKSFINASLNHWFAVNDTVPVDGVDPSVLFTYGAVKTGGTWSYTASSGTLTRTTRFTGDTNIQVGDIFVDANGARFPIWSVTLGSDVRLRIPRGLGTTAASPNPGNIDLTVALTANELNIVRGSAVFQWNSAYTVTSPPADPNRRTGSRITFTGGQLPNSIKVGMAFVDPTGAEFPIVAVTLSSGIIDVVGRPAAYAGGATQLRVVMMNNPRKLKLMDMKPTYGHEVIHFDECFPLHDREVRVDKQITSWKASLPADNRIRFAGGCSNASENGVAGIAKRHGVWLRFLNTSNEAEVEFTGWMTGFALITDPVNGYDGTPSVTVDGVAWDAGTLVRKLNVGGSSLPLNSVHPAQWLCRPEYKNLPPGVHTIRFNPSYAGETTVGPMAIFGVVVFNEMNPQSGEWTEIPGRIYADMTSYDHPLQRTIMPNYGARGGKMVRYVPRTAPTTRDWAFRDVPTKTASIGDSSTGSPTITNVTNIANFAVGDIVRIKYTSTAERRRITAVGSSSIDVNANPSTSLVGATIEWIGKSFYSVAPGSFGGGLYHDNEQEVVTVPFYACQDSQYAPGTAAAGDGSFMEHDVSGSGIVNRSSALPDRQSYVTANNVGFAPDNYWMDLSTAGKVRIGFVGTGLDIWWRYFAPSSASPDFNVGMTLDGISMGTVTVSATGAAAAVEAPPTGINSGSSLMGRDVSRFSTIIAQDLDYGFHTLEITVGGAITAAPYAFTIWEPKLPAFDGYPIWEGNYLATVPSTGGTLTTDDSTGIGTAHDVPTGWVLHHPGFIALPANPGTTVGSAASILAPSANASVDYTNSPYGRSMNTTYGTSSGTTDRTDFYFTFYGSAISFDMWANGTGVTYSVQFLDNDNTFKAHTALVSAGFDPNSSAATGTIPSTAVTNRTRYMYRLDNERIWICRVTIINTSGAGRTTDINAVRILSKFHLMQRNVHSINQNWAVARSGGRDRRQLDAVDYNFMTPPRSEDSKNNRTEASIIFDTDTFAPARAARMIVYSEGEWWKFSLTGVISGISGGDETLCRMSVDSLTGDATTGASSVATRPASYGIYPRVSVNANSAPYVPLSQELTKYLPRGFHIVCVYFTDTAGSYTAAVLTGYAKIVGMPYPDRGAINPQPLEATLSWKNSPDRLAYN